MIQIYANYSFPWAIALIVGFPLLVIGLGELIYRLQRRAKPLADTLRIVRNLVLPVFVSMLFEQAKGDTWQSRVPKLLIDLFRLFLVFLGGAIVLATV